MSDGRGGGAGGAAPPVISVDGPAASGKGTVAQQVAAALGFHYLDSGKLYRAAALAGQRRGISPDDSAGMAETLRGLMAQGAGENSAGENLDALLRDDALITPEIGQRASLVAADAELRRLLLPLQRAMRRPPGLVADGRDMGTVVFPDAALRVFLTASLAVRAERRRAQLAARGICVKITAVRADIEQRDRQDETRATAPLKPSADALPVDSTDIPIGDIVATILRAYRDAAS